MVMSLQAPVDFSKRLYTGSATLTKASYEFNGRYSEIVTCILIMD